MIIFGFGLQQPNGKHSNTVTIDCHVSLKLRASNYSGKFAYLNKLLSVSRDNVYFCSLPLHYSYLIESQSTLRSQAVPKMLKDLEKQSL